MSNYPLHVEATRWAQRMIGLLPPDVRWSYYICDNDDPVVPGTLNVYVGEEHWEPIAKLLNLPIYGTLVDKDRDFLIYRCGPVHVSFTTENPNGN
jgi:hypothetical protein